MKKVSKLIWMLAFICICSGCVADKNGHQKSVKNATVNDATEQKFPEKFSYDSEMLQIDIKEIKPKHAVWFQSFETEYPISYEDLGRVFMPDDGSNIVKQNENMILSKETDGDFHKEFYTWGNNTCTYNTVSAQEIQACIRTDKYNEDYNLSKYEDKKTFSFATADEVKKKIDKEISDYGIDLSHDFVCETYYLDHDIMRKEENHLDMDGNEMKEQYKKNWSEKDDTYLMYFHHVCSGLRDFQNNPYWNEKAQNMNAQITILYNKSGIIYFYLQNMYKYTGTNEQIGLMDFNDVMQSVIDYFDSIVDGAERRILSAELIADAEKDKSREKELIPVWAFQVEETPKDDTAYKYELRVNAVTGKVIVQ